MSYHIFVMTNLVETQQTQGTCDEDYTRVNCFCKKDSDCGPDLITTNTWNGIPTGKCIVSSVNSTIKVCEISSWCPVERETSNDDLVNMIQNVENFTIFIKNDVQFRLFNKKERNLADNITTDFITKCPYQKPRDPLCPTFLIGEILEKAEPNPTERKQMFQKGAVIEIGLNWDCNYDFYWRKCIPSYTFTRYDLPFSKSTSASGFNFRFSDKFETNGTFYRKLTKAYGLRFIIAVSGKAGKFNFVPLLLSLGSGLGLLSVATLIADFVLLNITKKKKFYQQLKLFDYKNEDLTDQEKSNLTFE